MANEMTKPASSQEIEKTHSVPLYVPRVDIYEKDKALVVVADMPGIDDKSVDVHFEKGVLTLSGRVEIKAHEGYRGLYREYQMGNYERSFSVPENIVIDKIEASVKNGVLTVVLPIAPEPEPRKIAVKVG